MGSTMSQYAFVSTKNEEFPISAWIHLSNEFLIHKFHSQQDIKAQILYISALQK